MRLEDAPCVRVGQALEVPEVGAVEDMSLELLYGRESGAGEGGHGPAAGRRQLRDSRRSVTWGLLGAAGLRARQLQRTSCTLHHKACTVRVTCFAALKLNLGLPVPTRTDL